MDQRSCRSLFLSLSWKRAGPNVELLCRNDTLACSNARRSDVTAIRATQNSKQQPTERRKPEKNASCPYLDHPVQGWALRGISMDSGCVVTVAAAHQGRQHNDAVYMLFFFFFLSVSCLGQRQAEGNAHQASEAGRRQEQGQAGPGSGVPQADHRSPSVPQAGSGEGRKRQRRRLCLAPECSFLREGWSFGSVSAGHHAVRHIGSLPLETPARIASLRCCPLVGIFVSSLREPCRPSLWCRVQRVFMHHRGVFRAPRRMHAGQEVNMMLSFLLPRRVPATRPHMKHDC